MEGEINHVLGEGLTECDLVTLLDKVTDGVGILIGVTGCEPLVCHVEEREVTAVLDDIGDGPPLFGSRVNTSRVVRTCVKEEGTALRGILDICEETINVESDRLLVVVPVLLHFQPRVLEDRSVIGP